MDQSSWDVVVIGSGGAGLLAACVAADRGLTTLVLESTDLIGGTTALSGGQVWIPCSAPQARAGFPDSADAALSYLRQVTKSTSADALLDSFVVHGRSMIDYVEHDLGMPFQSIDRGDYHPNLAGAGHGRSLEPQPVSTLPLGTWGSRVRTSPARRPITGPEGRTGLAEAEIVERERQGIRTQGAGLVAGLVAAALERGVEIRTQAPVTGVSVGADGRYAVQIDGGATATATNVVLAAGGFAGAPAVRAQHLPPIDIVPTTAPGANGDALRFGTDLGGHLTQLAEAWWTPAVTIPAADDGGADEYRNVVRELAYPGSFIVNAAGERFVDEATSYNELGKRFFAVDAECGTYPNEAAWLIFDSEFKRTRTVAGVPAAAPAPGWFTEAGTLSELAERTGIDADGLAATATRMNDFAATGVDLDFGRGATAHDQFNGDRTHTPNACLGPIHTAPFFAVPIGLGANGTKGGLVVDDLSRVLDDDDAPIRGLFAIGEAAAALMGPGYAGSGASLGPALTAAYLLRDSLVAPSGVAPTQVSTQQPALR